MYQQRNDRSGFGGNKNSFGGYSRGGGGSVSRAGDPSGERSDRSARPSYRGNSSGRPSFGGSRPSFGGQNRSFSGPRSNNGGGRFKVKYIDPRLFERAAVDVKPEPVVIKHQFADFDLPQNLKNNLNTVGFVTPTPIQDQALEPALEGKDVLGLADTGTGKTAAFLLPILKKLSINPNQNALIMAPTRELAVQIREDLRNLSQGMSIYSAILIGGANIFRQIQELHRRPHIFIGTPGRLKDLYERRVLNLSNTHTVVLDEMDRMLDMGFVKDITEILALLPKERQTLLFSATIDDKVEAIARQNMVNPVKISVKTGATAANIDQKVIRVVGKINKMDKLRELLRQQDYTKVLIFGRTKYGVEDISVALASDGFAVGAIHGNKRQSQRETVLRSFRAGQIKILIATDVAARGLDVKDISHVINFDQPATYEDYVHRIGRTGRAGKTGQSITFVE